MTAILLPVVDGSASGVGAQSLRPYAISSVQR